MLLLCVFCMDTATARSLNDVLNENPVHELFPKADWMEPEQSRSDPAARPKATIAAVYYCWLWTWRPVHFIQPHHWC